jgi:hypothetical protein
MHVDELAKACGVKAADVRAVCAAMARDRAVYRALCHRVHLEYATGRPANDAGTDVEDPPPLKVRLVREFAGSPAGAVLEKPYREALSLLNARIAELIPA